MLKWSAFILISAIFLFFSWGSLYKLKSHGFYRFFAWEIVAVLLLLNVDQWFTNPFDWYQILSWILLVISLFPLFFGIHGLATRGHPNHRREGEPQLWGIERTTVLVTSGIYRYIRHPLYSSLMLLSWGIVLKSPSWYDVLLGLAASVFLVATAWADERECISFFGDEYRQYMQRSRMFVPFLF